MKARRALITGASGQDGYYLSKLLASRGVEVLGVDQRVTSGSDPVVVNVDMTSVPDIERTVRDFMPDECYHLAAYHRSSTTLAHQNEREEEESYLSVNLLATRQLLRVLIEVCPQCRVFLAGSSHMFGPVREAPQSEATPFRPNSPYGITKVAAYQFAKMYRERGLLFCSLGILYNHESPRRSLDFVTAKIAQGAVDVLSGKAKEVVVGNLDSRVDWGFAGDYVDAMWRILQHDEADDFIVASGETHTVREFAEAAFATVGLDWSKYVREERAVHRPQHADVVYQGDISKIRTVLGWRPQTSFHALVEMMVKDRLARCAG